MEQPFVLGGRPAERFSWRADRGVRSSSHSATHSATHSAGAGNLQKGDYQFASEILEELEAEGHLDSTITKLRGKIAAAIRRKTIDQLIETAQSRIDADGEHLQRFAFQHARDALHCILQRRPADARALELLKEVDRIEQEHARARQETEQLFQAALAADQRGEISSALSKLERLHERIQSAYAAAKQKMESGNFSAALAIRAEQLEKKPGHALFQALKIDIEERRPLAVRANLTFALGARRTG
ncbi:MAG TPA: hypothetical protein VKV17_04775 [Bryobacteraceae bacterium]|nr:hypothetical protein [Bryobacteraceae bacterium]